jgi:squalene monooxygenase
LEAWPIASIRAPQPLVLIGHFFAVAAYGTYQLCAACNSILEYPKALLKSASVMTSAVCVIAPLTWQELKVILTPW